SRARWSGSGRACRKEKASEGLRQHDEGSAEAAAADARHAGGDRQEEGRGHRRRRHGLCRGQRQAGVDLHQDRPGSHQQRRRSDARGPRTRRVQRGAAQVARPRQAGDGQAHGGPEDPGPRALVAYYPEPVARLIDALQRLPGIGPKTAQRLTFFLLKRPLEEVRELSTALTAVKERIVYCTTCFNVTDQDPCRICADPARDSAVLCVVEEPNDLLAMERTGEYKGRYHVLLGALSPLHGIGPDDLKVRELLMRLEDSPPREVILATNPNVEGEATALCPGKLLRALGVRVTRIARGLPVGGDLEYADQVTLTKALEGRRELG